MSIVRIQFQNSQSRWSDLQICVSLGKEIRPAGKQERVAVSKVGRPEQIPPRLSTTIFPAYTSTRCLMQTPHGKASWNIERCWWRIRQQTFRGVVMALECLVSEAWQSRRSCEMMAYHGESRIWRSSFLNRPMMAFFAYLGPHLT